MKHESVKKEVDDALRATSKVRTSLRRFEKRIDNDKDRFVEFVRLEDAKWAILYAEKCLAQLLDYSEGRESQDETKGSDEA